MHGGMAGSAEKIRQAGVVSCMTCEVAWLQVVVELRRFAQRHSGICQSESPCPCNLLRFAAWPGLAVPQPGRHARPHIYPLGESDALLASCKRPPSYDGYTGVGGFRLKELTQCSQGCSFFLFYRCYRVRWGTLSYQTHANLC